MVQIENSWECNLEINRIIGLKFKNQYKLVTMTIKKNNNSNKGNFFFIKKYTNFKSLSYTLRKKKV
jgi:hypothetical protein